jgi:serine/threonine protein kinase/Tfp pilus assembly protein PilF
MTGDEWKRVKEIAAAAMVRPDAERSGFVAAQCGNDASLSLEVRSLLDAMVQAADLYEAPRLTTAHALAGLVDLDDGRGAVVGTRIGAYRIVQEIGRGGMGAAYLATRDDQAYDKRVAVKLIKRGMDTDAILRRFRHERQILAHLEHPNIVMLLDGGTTSDGLPYFVMEYVDGQPIDKYCDSHALPIATRLKLFQAVCAAVHHAHERRIVHRDLKPNNILVTSAGVPKLLDFGIAKMLEAEPGPRTEEPTLAARAMTPQYASPEQIRGEALTRATDIYSLGVLLYVLLTGRMPYSLERRSAAEAERVICDEVPSRPSTAVDAAASRSRGESHKSVARQFAGNLDAIVMTALSKLPANRYATAKALADDIQHYLDGLPLAVARRGLPVRTKVRRVLLAAAILVLATMTGSLLLDRPSEPTVAAVGPKSIAVLPLLNTSGDVELDYLADGVTEGIITRLSRAPQLKVIARNSIYRYKGVSVDPLLAARELGVEAVLSGRVTPRGDRMALTAELIDARDGRRLWGDSYERPVGGLQALQTELAQEIATGLRLQLSHPERARVAQIETRSSDAYQLYLKGRYFWNKRTSAGLHTSVKYFSEAVQKDPRFAVAYAGLADSYGLLTEYHALPAEQTYPEATRAVTRALEISDELAEAHTSLAYIKHFYEWDWPAAEREFLRALDLNPNYATAHQWYAEYLSSRGRPDEALAEIAKAKDLDPLSLIVQVVEAQILYMAGRYDAAIEAGLKAVEMDANFPEAYDSLKRSYDQKGLYADAIAARQKRRALLGLDATLTPALRTAADATTPRTYWKKRLEQELVEWRTEGQHPYEFAELFAQAGQEAHALDWLERACREHDFMLVYVTVAPNLAPLRPTPRYLEILRRGCRM